VRNCCFRLFCYCPLWLLLKMSKYPLRVQPSDVKHDVHEAQSGTVIREASMPIPSEVRTDGTATVSPDQESADKAMASKEPGPQYRLVCEAEVALAAGVIYEMRRGGASDCSGHGRTPGTESGGVRDESGASIRGS